jgi:magnesium chelatase family protein
MVPTMTLAEALKTIRIHRVAGRTGARTALVTTRPFRAPHHTIAGVGLIGGGPVPRPGDMSRAHQGVRLLNARPECRRHVLEVLRQPLEESLTEIRSPARHKSV